MKRYLFIPKAIWVFIGTSEILVVNKVCRGTYLYLPTKISTWSFWFKSLSKNIYFPGSGSSKPLCTVSCGESVKMTAVSTTSQPGKTSQESVSQLGSLVGTKEWSKKVAKGAKGAKGIKKSFAKLIPGLHLNATPGTVLYRVEGSPRRTGITQSNILFTYFLLLLYLCTEV